MRIINFIFASQKKESRMGHKIMRNAFWLTAGDVANRLLKAVLIVYATRILPISEYGAFSFALNLVSLVFVVADLGVSSVLQRRLAEKDDKEYLSSSFAIKLCLLALAIVITIVAALASDPKVMGLALILIVMTGFDALKGFFLVIHTARNRMDKMAISNTLETAATVAVGLFMIFSFPSASTLAWSYAFGALISLCYVLFTVQPSLPGIFSAANSALIKKILLAGWPLALGGIAWGLMNTTDSLILGWIKGLDTVAFYNAAAKIPQFLGPIGGIIIGATFPSLVATMQNPDAHKKLFSRINEALFAITLPVAAGGIIIAHPLIQKLYGAQYDPAAFVLGFLLLNLIQTAISFFLMQLIFVHNHQAQSLLYVITAWLINITLCIALVPYYGMIGAALASLVSQSVIFFSHAHFVKTRYKLPIF